jgi:thioredoxin-dependent peroxiredoxin
MRKNPVTLIATLAVATGLAAAAQAALPVGAAAPDFPLQGAIGGKDMTFSLKSALAKGPVVLYFFPSAYTSGCTIETHAFAEAAADYAKLGATLIGVTAGQTERIKSFSVEACRSKFPLAADPGAKVAARYKSKIPLMGLASRDSYVIAPDGRIILSYSDMSPNQHVARTLAAVKAWRAAHPG